MTVRKSTLWLLVYMLIWLMPSALALPTAVQVVLRLALFCWIVIRLRRPNAVLVLSVIYLLLSLISVLLADKSFENLLKTVASLSVFIGMGIFFYQHSNKEQLMKQCLEIISLFLLLDVLIAIFVPQGLTQNQNGDPVYFSGGKFTACYLYIVWMMLLFINKRSLRKFHTVLIAAVGVLYAYYVDCNTGVLAIAFFGIMMLLPRFLTTRKRQIIWLAVMLVLNYLIVFLQVQTTVPWISTFITNVLHRTTHMTGRIRIYNSISQIMENHWLWGFGFTSSRITDVTGLANMQNGFLQLIYTGGVVGLTCYMAILGIAVWKITNLKNMNLSSILIASITAFLVVSIVEIPFTNGLFYLALSCIFALTRDEEERAGIEVQAI